MNWTIRFDDGQPTFWLRLWGRRIPGLASQILQHLAPLLATEAGLPLGEMAVPTSTRTYHFTLYVLRGTERVRADITFWVDVERASRAYHVRQAQLAFPPADVLEIEGIP